MVSVMVVGCAPESPAWHTRACVRCRACPRCYAGDYASGRDARAAHTRHRRTRRGHPAGAWEQRCCAAYGLCLPRISTVRTLLPWSTKEAVMRPARVCWTIDARVSMPHRRCPLRPVPRAAWAEHRCAVHMRPRDIKQRERVTMVFGSSPAGVTHCRVHQRAWVASLDRWVAFHVPTRDGSTSRDAPCDRCPARHQRAEGVGGASGGAGHARGTHQRRAVERCIPGDTRAS